MNSRKNRGAVIGTVSVLAGLVTGVVALKELFAYSPYGNPGAGEVGLWLAVSAVLMIGIPLIVAFVRFAVRAVRAEAEWKRSLTPEQRLAVDIAETAALTEAHLVWKRHNREESARLTESVMGKKRGDPRDA